ncbi:Diels-Alderase fsa2 [Fusarium austroafricanum]|uniref:Diels-Alderase fsa2 n=1 Tax=Fusarium austroafricanum TaxID=2364996 RepID=A0A8H4P2Z4_9HYPO|nr:Diels-Alderase fsa2 [Fusarium austroafricanum]
MAEQTVSHFKIEQSIAQDVVPPSPFIPNFGNIFPKFVPVIPKTAWELWYFDGISSEDQSAIVIAVTRDARGLKLGGFKVQVFVVWSDHRTWHRDLFFPESIVKSDDNGATTGIWKDTGGNNSISFGVTGDSSRATLVFAVPGVVQGKMHLKALPGDIGLNTDPALGPSVVYVRPIGRASVQAELSLFSPDSTEPQHFALGTSANGGMDRVWSMLSWPQVMTESYYLRAHVGPYAMQIMRIFSELDSGNKPYTMARLYCEGKLVCTAQQVINHGDDASSDSLILSKEYGDSPAGAVTGAYRDKNTGYVVEFVEGENKRSWRFRVSHQGIIWNTPTSDPGPDATGNTGFMELVIGGADGESYRGIGTGGQCEMS